jgi:hypothetical protein
MFSQPGILHLNKHWVLLAASLHITAMATITPFKIAIADEKVRRLKQKLLFTDFPDEVTNTKDPRARGVPLIDIKRLTAHWAETFDWRKAEAKLNDLPQFTTEIDVEKFGRYKIHYVHKKSDSEQAIPLLFLHSWPGGFFEVSKLLPYLNNSDNEPAFHVIAPSLVDFGFSSGSEHVCMVPIQGCRSNRVV